MFKKQKELKKENLEKVNILEKIKTFFAAIYFFFEDLYYLLLDKINKVIPINKITDKIDSFAPSFVIFILVIAVLVYLLLFANIFVSEYSFEVSVVDELGNTIPNAEVSLYRNQELLIQKNTNVFGIAEFYSVRARSVNINVNKKEYLSLEQEIKLRKDLSYLEFVLEIDRDFYLAEYDTPARTRTISFITANNIIITERLDASFVCSNPAVTPDPTSRSITSGQVVVNQPARCGSLRYDVISDSFENKTNQVVPEDNKIFLQRNVVNNVGNLTLNVFNINKNALQNSIVTIYQQSQPNVSFNNGTTDHYGKHIFENLREGNYYYTASRQGYVSVPKVGPTEIFKNTTTTKDILLLTLEDLENFDCSNPLYSEYCVGTNVDCFNELMGPYVIFDEDGCSVGIYKYIDVTLKDKDTQEPVFADIEIYRKELDSNSFSPTGLKETDTNHSLFYVFDGYQYQVKVINTTEKGYLTPLPVTLQNLDTNITIELEYSSALNSGDVNVLVTRQGYPIAGAHVFLYYGDGDYKDQIVDSSISKITPSNGKVNFSAVRANQSYYAHAITFGNQTYEGISETRFLDANETVALDVSLVPSQKTFRLKVTNTSDYDVDFYNAYGERFFTYTEVETDVPGEKIFIFTGDEQNIYLIISSSTNGPYLTDKIALKQNAEVYKEITLSSSQECPSTNVEYLGMFNDAGQKVETIDLNVNTLDKTYKKKYKFVSCNNPTYEYAFIRTGKNIFSNEDALYIQTINHFPTNQIIKTNGTRYAGELQAWDFDYYNNFYNDDHSQSNNDKTKWTKIDFTGFNDFDVTTIEFSVDVKFNTQQIFNKTQYVSYHRSLAQKEENYAFKPNLSNYTSWEIRPDGFFYAPTQEVEISFDTENVYQYRLLNKLGIPFFKNADNYILYFTEDQSGSYTFDLDVLYLMDSDEGDFSLSSQNTNNNLLYKNYYYSDGDFILLKQRLPTETFESPKDQFNIDINGLFGRSYNIKSDFDVTGFFSTEGQPKIKFNFFGENKEINVLSYFDGEYQVNINTEGYDNQIYFGENQLSFSVYDKYNEPVEGVLVKRSVGDIFLEACTTEIDGACELNEPITISNDQLIYSEIVFKFILPDVGASNNEIAVVSKSILPGILILDKNKEIIETNLEYDIAILRSGNYIIQNNINNQEYYIRNLTSSSKTLEEVYATSNQQIIDIENTNELLEDNNNTSLEVWTNDDTQINAPILMNLPIAINNTNYVSEVDHFVNKINFFNSIDVLYDTNLNVSLEAIDLGEGLSLANEYGVYDKGDNVIGTELIKNLFDEVIVEYNLKNNTNKTIRITDIDVDVKTPNIISKDYILASIIGGLPEYQTNNFYDISVGEEIDLEILLQREPQQISGETELEIKLSFISDINKPTREYVLPINVFVKVYEKEQLLNLQTLSFTNQINCNTGNCQISGSYNIENKTKSHDFKLEDFTYTSEIDSLLGDASYPENKIIDRNKTTSINFNIDIDKEELEEIVYENKDITNTLKFVHKNNIENFETTISKTHLFTILNYADTMTDIPEIDGTFCIGYGGKEINGNYIMIGNCDTTEQECLSGEDAVPKLSYDWTTTETIENCIVDGISDSANMYCDSVQMMINLFYKISESYDDFYIDLMYDNVTNNLLEDFIDCLTNEKCVLSTNIKSTLLNRDNVTDFIEFIEEEEKTYNITRNSKEPGRYLVTFNDFDIESLEELTINLQLQTPIRASERNMFYYLPINLPLMSNEYEERDYGLNIELLQETLKLNEIHNNEVVIDEIIHNVNNNNLSSLNIGVFTNNLEEAISRKDNILSIGRQEVEQNKYHFSLSYVPTIPSTIYAKAACLDSSNLEYLLINPEDQIRPIDLSTWLFWKEIDSEEIYNDKKKIDSDYGTYLGHSLEISSQTPINKLLKTNIYLPKNLENISQYKLTLEHQLLDNDQNTSFYYISDDVADTEKQRSFVSNIDQNIINKLNNLTTLFELISSGEICVLNTYNKTDLYWTEEALEKYNGGEENLIINKANVNNTTSCPTDQSSQQET